MDQTRASDRIKQTRKIKDKNARLGGRWAGGETGPEGRRAQRTPRLLAWGDEGSCPSGVLNLQACDASRARRAQAARPKGAVPTQRVGCSDRRPGTRHTNPSSLLKRLFVRLLPWARDCAGRVATESAQSSQPAPGLLQLFSPFDRGRHRDSGKMGPHGC